ncbi:MAG: hypothetical protein OSJ44_05275 [Lachnospiraceae bacterium]|nr:hypothetical protein [Lachnospiraceae bacterium]
MGIGRVSSWNCMSDMQMNPTGMTDTKSKSIQKEITDVQQKMQKLPSKEEYSPSEMADERKKLQKEISGLNIKLKLHQEKLLKSQKREAMLAKMQEEKELSPDKTEKEEASDREEQAKRQETVLTKNSDGTVILKEEKNPEGKGSVETEDEAKENIETDTKEDAGLSHKEMHAMVSANHSIQQADRQGVVIARMKEGVVILKGEISQDERYGADTGKKQAELEKMEKREQRARAFQSSSLGEANSTVRSAAKGNLPGAKDRVQTRDNNVVKFFQEDEAVRQRFQISFVS